MIDGLDYYCGQRLAQMEQQVMAGLLEIKLQVDKDSLPYVPLTTGISGYRELFSHVFS
jgi:hypothetical protein